MCVTESVNSQSCSASSLQLQRGRDHGCLSTSVRDLAQVRCVSCIKVHSGFINWKKRGKMRFLLMS